ncbi:hypothetical protein PPERSA_11442 [Pseudocohnilembus persalinus]|uniref:Uncharacterized protein n=1 Tax=Pseudocohnilembus persalinus TaxID=266149 RepID=A0A0V0QXI6_PSEPJ|nr:hypothetical protein PPERSA_11442 [Pseudocohnilembus persalinus]|eukprot:KRX06797.1 hypothetical protein PPERSA_11442 [Pseudocohnilembus persalinus]
MQKINQTLPAGNLQEHKKIIQQKNLFNYKPNQRYGEDEQSSQFQTYAEQASQEKKKKIILQLEKQKQDDIQDNNYNKNKNNRSQNLEEQIAKNNKENQLDDKESLQINLKEWGMYDENEEENEQIKQYYQNQIYNSQKILEQVSPKNLLKSQSLNPNLKQPKITRQNFNVQQKSRNRSSKIGQNIVKNQAQKNLLQDENKDGKFDKKCQFTLNDIGFQNENLACLSKTVDNKQVELNKIISKKESLKEQNKKNRKIFQKTLNVQNVKDFEVMKKTFSKTEFNFSPNKKQKEKQIINEIENENFNVLIQSSSEENYYVKQDLLADRIREKDEIYKLVDQKCNIVYKNLYQTQKKLNELQDYQQTIKEQEHQNYIIEQEKRMQKVRNIKRNSLIKM